MQRAASAAASIAPVSCCGRGGFTGVVAIGRALHSTCTSPSYASLTHHRPSSAPHHNTSSSLTSAAAAAIGRDRGGWGRSDRGRGLVPLVHKWNFCGAQLDIWDENFLMSKTARLNIRSTTDGCWDITIFRFLKMAAGHHLGFSNSVNHLRSRTGTVLETSIFAT